MFCYQTIFLSYICNKLFFVCSEMVMTQEQLKFVSRLSLSVAPACGRVFKWVAFLKLLSSLPFWSAVSFCCYLCSCLWPLNLLLLISHELGNHMSRRSESCNQNFQYKVDGLGGGPFLWAKVALDISFAV